MNGKDIIDRAIRKAINGGWRGDMLGIRVEQQGDGIVRVYWDNTEWSVFDIIYNHAFAKALWGEEQKGPPRGNTGGRFDNGGMAMFEQIYKHGWKYYLQMMVISDDPIEYLGDHMND